MNCMWGLQLLVVRDGRNKEAMAPPPDDFTNSQFEKTGSRPR